VFVADTNLLLHAVNPDVPEHQQASGLVEQWRREPRAWFLTWGIVYEFLRVSTHRAVFPRPLTLPLAWEYVVSILSAGSCSVLVETDRHAAVLSELAVSHPRLAGNPLHDLHTAALMKEHGVSEIRTADTDFHQFDFLRVVNPLTSG
jgi:toxin-antitoxin system PIN domain toxin